MSTHTQTHTTHVTLPACFISSPPSHSVPICRWVWLEAGALPEAESAVGVGGFGYPVSEGREGREGEGTIRLVRHTCLCLSCPVLCVSVCPGHGCHQCSQEVLRLPDGAVQ